MDKKYTKLVKDMIWGGLQNARFDVKSATALPPTRIVLVNDNDFSRAQRTALQILESMKSRNDLPTDRKQLEDYVDGTIASINFLSTIGWIGKDFHEKTDKQLIQECLEAIEELNRVGGKFADKADAYQFSLDNLIKNSKNK